MPAQCWLCLLCALLLCDVSNSWFEDDYRRARWPRIMGYPRDWDVDWTASQRRYQKPWSYEYQRDEAATSALRPRVETLGVWHSQQRGSALIPHRGASVRVRPDRGFSSKFYRGTVTSTVSDGPSPRRRGHRSYHQGNPAAYWQYRQDEPVYKVCARCPSDRAVLAPRGANIVLMEVPPLIPCHPWSSVDKVKQEIVVGPQPGSRVQEGTRKVVIRLHHRRRTLATCVIRYNVIVRQCQEIVPELGVNISCPHGPAWGAVCNFSCHPGYKLLGDDHVRCTDDLEWSGDVPQCLPTTTCPAPASPDHGYLKCRTPHQHPATDLGMLPDGTVCLYQCDPGYAVPPTQWGLIEVRCVAGDWDSHMDPTCVETNELEDEEILSETTISNKPSFDDSGCKEGFCQHGGKCLMVLGSPMCSCLPGRFGLLCEETDKSLDPSNSVA